MQEQEIEEKVPQRYISEIPEIKFLSPMKLDHSPSWIERESVRRCPNSGIKKGRRKRTQSVEVSTHFQMSASHLGFLIQEQKSSQLENLHLQANRSLKQYYQTLQNLFMRVYDQCIKISRKVSESKEEIISGMKERDLIQILLKIDKWDNKNWIKLRVFSSNVAILESDHRAFQEKIEFISRRIVFNMNKTDKIKQCFTDHELKEKWNSLISNIELKSFRTNDETRLKSVQAIKRAPQIMAFFQFQQFAQEYLCRQDFIENVRKRSSRHRLQQLDEEYLPKFSFEFVFIQIFVLGQSFCEDDRDAEEYYRSMCQLI